MALICAEHDDHILVGERVFGVANGEAIVAVCERALRVLPCDEYYSEKFLGGIDIYTATSTPNASSTSQSYYNLEFGDYLCTISQTTLRKYLPRVATLLL